MGNLELSTEVNRLNSPPLDKKTKFADDIFKRIFINEKFYILIRISLCDALIPANVLRLVYNRWHRKVVKPVGILAIREFEMCPAQVLNILIAWHTHGQKRVVLNTYISRHSDACMRHWTESLCIASSNACRQFGAMSLLEPAMDFCQVNP